MYWTLVCVVYDVKFLIVFAHSRHESLAESLRGVDSYAGEINDDPHHDPASTLHKLTHTGTGIWF